MKKGILGRIAYGAYESFIGYMKDSMGVESTTDRYLDSVNSRRKPERDPNVPCIHLDSILKQN